MAVGAIEELAAGFLNMPDKPDKQVKRLRMLWLVE